jgi:hypothetical protein
VLWQQHSVLLPQPCNNGSIREGRIVGRSGGGSSGNREATRNKNNTGMWSSVRAGGEGNQKTTMREEFFVGKAACFNPHHTVCASTCVYVGISLSLFVSQKADGGKK